MKYLVMEGRYNFGQETDVMFATNDKEEAIEAAKDFGQGMVVVCLDKKGNKLRIFTAAYKSDLALTG